VNQETKKAQEKPVLSAESFHRLLAAAYLLQVEIDRTVPQPIEAGHTNPFRAGAIVQRRTSSLLVGQPSLLASRSALPIFAKSAERVCLSRVSPVPETATEVAGASMANAVAEGQGRFGNYSGSLMPPVGPTVLNATKIFASRAMFFKAVEALSIATIFFAVTGVSIGRPLLANPGHTAMLAEMREEQSSSLPRVPPTIPIAKILASGRPVTVTPTSRHLPNVAESDTVAEDAVVHYLKQALDLPGQATKKPAKLTAETVVQYGPDVTVWSGNLTQRDGRDRLRR
jgi:hypothetical protein